MLDAAVAWRAESAWDAVSLEGGGSGLTTGAPGVVLSPLCHVDMASLIVRRTATSAFTTLVRERWGFDVPAPGRAHFGPRGGLVWSAPDLWLAVADAIGDLDDLAGLLEGVGAVSMQGDGRCMVEVDGPDARSALAKCLSIDLHPDVFTPGCAAVTAFEHVSVSIWQRDGASTLTLCMPRSVAGSLWRALLAAAREYGCETRLPL